MDHSPGPARAISRVVSPLNRVFDWLYSSRYNPLYRSGTLAVAFLCVLIITGFYLLFFYSVSAPYSSLVNLQQQAWLGRWIRALHRYSTAATLVAIVFHILQLLVQSKTWGPRFLAWISGVVLLAGVLLTAWSGYVMVWDLHGQKMAMAGAELLGVIPVIHETVVQAFNGQNPVSASFFFMNLFLHVALPLVLIFAMWVHTSRLSRAIWFPRRRIMVGSIGAFVLLSILWPAALAAPGDLFVIPGKYPLDFFSGFWIPALDRFGPRWVLAGWIVGAVLLSSIPFWWRPRRVDARPVSAVDESQCSGCTQCVHDCPYEAIRMRPRPDGKRLMAKILPERCVSCAICTASCDDLAIGPPGRDGVSQIREVEKFCRETLSFSVGTDKAAGSERRPRLVFISCTNNGSLCGYGYSSAMKFQSLGAMVRERTRAKDFASSHDVEVWEVECCGVLLSKTLETILQHADGLFIAGCPARNCHNRDGLELLSGRLFERRVPFLDRSIDRRRLCVVTGSDAEVKHVVGELQAFSQRVRDLKCNSAGSGEEESNASTTDERQSSLSIAQRVRLVLSSILVICLIAGLSQYPVGRDPNYGIVRVSGRLPGFLRENCHIPSPEEEKGVPFHMRRKEICVETELNYQVVAKVDQQTPRTFEVAASSSELEQPKFMNVDLPLEVGFHTIEVEIRRRDNNMILSSLSEGYEISAGRILLLGYDSGTNTFLRLPHP